MVLRDLEPGINQVFSIPICQIVVPEGRIRSLKVAQAAAIGSAMDADGQYDAITVQYGQGGLELIDGLHRLEGAKLIGWSVIDATIAPLSRSGRRQEILSGWARADHDVFDKAGGIKALADMARVEAGLPEGDLRQFNGRKKLADVDLGHVTKSIPWDIETAGALDIDRRTVGKYLALGQAFEASEVAILRAANVADQRRPLEMLADVDADLRAKVLQRFEAGWRGTIAEAIAQMSGLVRDDSPVARATSSILKTARKWDNQARANLWNELNALCWPDGRLRSADDLERLR